jgi:thiol-disulfide isomerase/thioredoxin
MRTYARVLIVLVVVAVIAVITSRIVLPWLLNGSDVSSLSTQALFAANLPDPSGKTQAVKQWQGKVAVVNFWATWCPPCREEMPELSQLQDKYRSQGVVVLGIAADELDKVKEFSKSMPVSYALLVGDFEGMNLAQSLGNHNGVLPYTVILNADGQVVKSYFGRINLQQLEQTLQPLLADAR